ncbi:related to dehydrogenase/reductase [Cephalotrichum gorgonifer]|uniref:3beta-hydroxysteroid 3-dehydrogenase n=1 Tax=Cephalotrichum gorgonifer TaxID=2041049 RepID=A0AAE8MUF4_9PEZI|nr:related to dehydrogenase/reductase [Cephalotrichum gorgonifer]
MAGTVVITGANGSLGHAFVQHFLSSYPKHTLIGTVRDASEDDPNINKLRRLIAKYPDAKVHIEQLDLASLASVRAFATLVSSQVTSGAVPRISAVVCNAFAWYLHGVELTPDGLEATFQISHLSHYLLVLRLLGSMDAQAGRIVMLGSDSHYPGRPHPLSKLVARVPADIEHLVRPEPDNPAEVFDRGFQRYGTAKLANVAFAYDLDKRLQADPDLARITVTVMDPRGLVESRAQSKQKLAMRVIFSILAMLMPLLRHLTSALRTNSDAGRDLVALSMDSEFQGKRGYFLGQKADSPAKEAKDQEIQKRLWDSCWRWAGLSEEETVLQNAAPKE